eukprot:Hpha_TRINITY_DN15796_c0_g4::TRINITY_DN15796_c0_g4_i1::g.37752::m.37752
MTHSRVHPGVAGRRRERRGLFLGVVGLAAFATTVAVFGFPQQVEPTKLEVEDKDPAPQPRHLLEQKQIQTQPVQGGTSDSATRPQAAALRPAGDVLRRNLGPHKLPPEDEIVRAQSPTPDDLLDLKGEKLLGEPTMDPEELREKLVTDGFGMIPGVLSQEVGGRLRKYLLGLLSVPGAVWKPNEGDNITEGTLGRVLMGLPPQWYRSLEVIMGNPEMHKYLSTLMPCRGVSGLSQHYRMTQLFITVNDRIKWHVDYPEQPPYKNKRTQMYNPTFCQYKVIFYLQDHSEEDDSNNSALSVVPNTFSKQPDFEDCVGCPSSGKPCCRAARKGKVPSSRYTSIQAHPKLGDLLVMDARSLHAASHPSLNLPLQELPEHPPPRKHKYRTFLQFLWGVTDNSFTDAMQKKKDRNLVTKHFKKLVFP